ncbi:MAG: hypothetical protein ACI4DY_02035 [Monoglobaceae bacterium]
MKRGYVKTKSFSRVGMIILCIIMVTGQLCAGAAFAEGEETAVAQIFYRDYEDYTGGNGFLSTTSPAEPGEFGTASGYASGVGFAAKAESVSGKNGKGVDFNTSAMTSATGTPTLTFNKTLSSGELYVAFDVKLSSASESVQALSASYIKLTNSDDTTAYACVGIGTDYKLYKGSTNGTGWNANSTEYVFDTAAYHKVEVTYDLDTKLVTYYVDGVSCGTKTTTAGNTNITGMTITFSNLIDYFDNFTIMHYANSAAEDAAMSAAASACAGNNTIQLRLTDSLYGVGLVLNDDNMSKLTLTKGGESVPVTVKKGESDGDYIITLTSGKLEDAEYTIGLNGAADTIGRMCASGELKVTPAVVQTKLFYRDYEDYTGGNGFLSTTTPAEPGEFGTASGYASGVGFAAKAESVSGKNGKGVDFNTSAMTSATGTPTLTFNKTLSSGELYVAFDVKLSSASESVQALSASYIKLTNSDDTTAYACVGIGTDYKLYKGSTNGTGWNANSTEYVFDTAAYHKVEVTYDLDTKLVTYYVDGVSVATKTTTAGNTNITGMIVTFSNLIDYFDNFTVMHYADSAAENASMTADASAGADGSTINVTLKDALLNSGLVVNSILSGDITVSSAAGDTVAVTGVTEGSKTGEYVLALESALPAAGVYTLNLPANLTDTVGKKIYDNKVEFSFLPANSAYLTLNGNSATATYNIGDVDYKGSVYIAAYCGNALAALAVESAKTDGIGTLTLNIGEDFAGKDISYKVFIWDEELVPLGNFNN